MSGIIYIDGVPQEFTGNLWDYAGMNIHRVDGPAIIWRDGATEWYLNGKNHRVGGPAFEGVSGYKAWIINGKRHREDGPAIECTDGTRYWCLNGKDYSFEDFLKQLPEEDAVMVKLTWG
jgi:hypothetical protein